MPLKIPPFTPVNIQPTAAEPFSTFVNNTPLARTPLSGTELVPIIQGGISSHVPPGQLGPPVTTFANLPASPSQGMIASITDGLAGNCGDGSCTTFGTNVTGGGGALNLLIWYNGSHWTLTGK